MALSTFFIDKGVFRAVWVALRAVSFPGVYSRRPVASPDIFRLSNNIQMIWANTTSVFAKMIYCHSRWNFPDKDFVSIPVSINQLPSATRKFNVELTIPLPGYYSNPQPASVCFYYLRLKSFYGWDWLWAFFIHIAIISHSTTEYIGKHLLAHIQRSKE